MILPLIAPDEIKKMYQYALAYNEKLIEHCAKNNIMICMQGKDFGMNNSTIMSPAVIRDVYLPLIKQVNEMIEQYGMIPFSTAAAISGVFSMISWLQVIKAINRFRKLPAWTPGG